MPNPTYPRDLRPFPDVRNVLSEPDEDEDSDEEEESDDDVDDDDDVQKEIIRRRALEKHLADIIQVMGEQEVDLITDKVEKSCAICKNVQWFKGWKALLAHADTFKKKKVYQHRGYADAIREALKSRSQSKTSDASGVGGTQTVPLGNANDRTIVWPPLLVIELRNKEGHLLRAVRTFLERFVKAFPNFQKPKFRPISHSTGFLQFQDNYTGFLDAEAVKNSYESYSFDLYIYFPTISTMRKLDPRSDVVDWKEERYHKKVTEPQMKAKQDYDQEQAKIREVKVVIESVIEDEENFKLKTRLFQNLIDSRKLEIEERKSRREQTIRDYEKKVKSLEEKFQRDIKISEAKYSSRISRLKEQIQQSENRLDKARNARVIEIQNLQKQLQELTSNRKQEEAQEALRKELQLLERKRVFTENLEKRLVDFDMKADEQESELLKKQHSEMTQLLEEADAWKKKFLQDWLEKKEALKKPEELKVQVKEEVKVPDCAICLDPLTEENRALLKPCGHTQLCMDCATSLYKEGREKRICPICRTRIIAKPALLPKKIFI